MSTFTICMDGRFYAVGMNLFADVVTSLEGGGTVRNVTTVSDRNEAIRKVALPHPWREAYDIARKAGNYIGQLYLEDHHVKEGIL